MPHDPILIAAVLSLNVALCEWLVRRTFLRHLGTALLVIIVTAVVANLGIVPTSTAEAPLYSAVFDYVAPLAIFWILLQVNLRQIIKAGGRMLAVFTLGAAGTVIGAVVGLGLIGREALGEQSTGLAAMFVGTYVGGSVNFNALALHYKVVDDGILYAASAAIDNIMTAVWMVATLAIPKTVLALRPHWHEARTAAIAAADADDDHDDSETLDPLDFGLTLAIGAAALWLSNLLASLGERHGVAIPSILILTTVALILGQLPAVPRLRGPRVLGMFAVYVFLAVIGALCDVAALQNIGTVGLSIFILVTVTIAIHGVVTFGLGAIFRIDPEIVAVASQANIGGGTSALALARSLQRPDLCLPAVLVGSLGYGAGTYAGFAVAEYVL